MAVTPANKIVRGGDLQTVGTEIKSAIADKQDTIADLSAIRSGAALGSTSVQPVDIEDMVEAEPIGSIIPPVNPSEFATNVKLTKNGQPVFPVTDVSLVMGLQTEIESALAEKQDVLVSGSTIKTVNNVSLLGGGNITIEGVGISTVTSAQDGTIVITLTNGDEITVDLNHVHPQYLKYVYLTDESSMPATPEADTLYLIAESNA